MTGAGRRAVISLAGPARRSGRAEPQGGPDIVHRYQPDAPDAAGRNVLELLVGCAGATPYSLDNVGMNATLDRKAVPTIQFANSKPGGVPNTNGLPMYFGYLLLTVGADTIHGQWRAFTNYDTKTFTGPGPGETPKFEVLDSFTWTHG